MPTKGVPVQVLAKKLQPHCKVVKIDTDKYPNLASRNRVQVTFSLAHDWLHRCLDRRKV